MQTDFKETAYDQLTADDYGVISTSETKWINRINKLKEAYPDQVDIRNVNSDSSIVARIPKSWFKIVPPRVLNLTDEEREKRGERLKKSRESMTQDIT